MSSRPNRAEDSEFGESDSGEPTIISFLRGQIEGPDQEP
jgi:hypothetical protein